MIPMASSRPPTHTVPRCRQGIRCILLDAAETQQLAAHGAVMFAPAFERRENDGLRWTYGTLIEGTGHWEIS